MVLSPNDEEVASSKKHTQFKTSMYKPYPIFQTKMVEIDTLFQTKTAKKTYCRTYLYSRYKGVPPT